MCQTCRDIKSPYIRWHTQFHFKNITRAEGCANYRIIKGHSYCYCNMSHNFSGNAEHFRKISFYINECDFCCGQDQVLMFGAHKFLGWGHLYTSQFFIYNGMWHFLPLSKNCSACCLDIALGHIANSTIFQIIVELFYYIHTIWNVRISRFNQKVVMNKCYFWGFYFKIIHPTDKVHPLNVPIPLNNLIYKIDDINITVA